MGKGCLQESIIGPVAWNWAMDELLNVLETQTNRDSVEAITYADDLVILIKADSRREVEQLGDGLIWVLDLWCTVHTS